MTAPQQPDESPAPGLSIPASPFAHDDGSAPQRVDCSAARAFAAGTGQGRAVMTALARSRLLVPIVAVADSTQTNSSGLDVDKDSHLATVLVQGPNGEQSDARLLQQRSHGERGERTHARLRSAVSVPRRRHWPRGQQPCWSTSLVRRRSQSQRAIYVRWRAPSTWRRRAAS